MTEQSQSSTIPNGALLQIANNILDLLEYDSELKDEEDLFSDQFFIVIVSHLVTDDKFDIKPGETGEEQVESLDKLLSFLSNIIDKDLSIISAEGIILDHDRLSTKRLLELIEELIKALKRENDESEENQISNDDNDESIDKKRKEMQRQMQMTDESNSDTMPRGNISDANINKNKKHHGMLDDDEDDGDLDEEDDDNSINRRMKKMQLAKEKEMAKKQAQKPQDQPQEEEKKLMGSSLSHDEHDDHLDTDKLLTDEMKADYSEQLRRKSEHSESIKDIDTSHRKEEHKNEANTSGNRERDNESMLTDPRAQSCFEALEYEKMVKIKQGEFDESLIRKTLTENDLSRFEQVLIANGEEEEQDQDQDHNQDIIEAQYPMGIDYNENNPNAQNETPVMNVSHISEVSKSKENSELQAKINSKSRKNESIDKKKDQIINKDIKDKDNQQKQPQTKAKAQDKAQQNNDRNDEDVPSLLDDSDKNQQSHTSSYYMAQNDKHDEHGYIDYEDSDLNYLTGNSIHSVPPAHTKFKLNSESSSELYKKSSILQSSSKNSKKNESNYYKDSAQSKKSKDSNTNNSKYKYKRDQEGGNSNSNSNIMNNKNNSNSNKNNKTNSMNKKQGHLSQSDISQSSIHSISQNSQIKIPKSKSECENILEELPLSDDILKFEIIKEFKRLYGNKLDKVFLQKNIQNSHNILDIILRNIKIAKQKMTNMSSTSPSPNQPQQDQSGSDDFITREFMHKHQKELQYILEYYKKEKNKRSKFQERALNNLSKNVCLMKKTQEIQTKLMEAEIERKKKARDTNQQQEQVRICNEIYSKALQLEKEKYLEEISYQMQLRERENEEKRRSMMEVDKYYTDKVAILKEILRREKRERNYEHQAKTQFLSMLGKDKKGKFKRQIEHVFEKFDEEDKKTDVEDKNQEEIEKIIKNYYKK